MHGLSPPLRDICAHETLHHQRGQPERNVLQDKPDLFRPFVFHMRQEMGIIFGEELLDLNKSVLAGTNDVGHTRKCSASIRKSSATPPQPCARCAEACSLSARPSYTQNTRPGYLRCNSQHGCVRSTHLLPAGPWISHILSTMNTGKRKARRF